MKFITLLALLFATSLHAATAQKTWGTNNNGTQAWRTFSSHETLDNVSIAATVAANALTVAIKTKAGADPSTADFVRAGFRHTTATTGTYTISQLATSASLVVPDTATLGGANAVQQYLYVYLIDNAGTIELAIAGSNAFDTAGEADLIVTTTTIGTGADDGRTLYSTTGRSNVPVRGPIARLSSTQATAGTYASAMTNVVVGANVKTPIESAASTASITNCPATGVWGDLTNTGTLTPGIWDISGGVIFTLNGATTTAASMGISATSGNSAPASGDQRWDTVPPTAAYDASMVAPAKRFTVTTAVPYYLKYTCTFSAGTPRALGRILAARVQ